MEIKGSDSTKFRSYGAVNTRTYASKNQNSSNQPVYMKAQTNGSHQGLSFSESLQSDNASAFKNTVETNFKSFMEPETNDIAQKVDELKFQAPIPKTSHEDYIPQAQGPYSDITNILESQAVSKPVFDACLKKQQHHYQAYKTYMDSMSSQRSKKSSLRALPQQFEGHDVKDYILLEGDLKSFQKDTPNFMDQEFQRDGDIKTKDSKKSDVINRSLLYQKKVNTANYISNQIQKGKSSDEALKDIQKAKNFWRSEILSMLDIEPHLEVQYPSRKAEMMDTESGMVSFKMTSQFEQRNPLSKDDLRIVHQAMKEDLSKVIDWDKSAEAMHIYPTPTPYHHRGFDQAYWKELSSTICHICEPEQTSEDIPVLKIAIGCDSLFEVVYDMSKTIETQPRVQVKHFLEHSAVEEDQIIIRKLSFIAHNFYELKQFYKNQQLVNEMFVKYQDTIQSLQSHVIEVENHPSKVLNNKTSAAYKSYNQFIGLEDDEDEFFDLEEEYDGAEMHKNAYDDFIKDYDFKQQEDDKDEFFDLQDPELQKDAFEYLKQIDQSLKEERDSYQIVQQQKQKETSVDEMFQRSEKILQKMVETSKEAIKEKPESLERSEEFNNWYQSTSTHLDLLFNNQPQPKKEVEVQQPEYFKNIQEIGNDITKLETEMKSNLTDTVLGQQIQEKLDQSNEKEEFVQPVTNKRKGRSFFSQY